MIGSPVYRLGMMLYLQDNQLTSLDLNGKGEIWNFDVASQSYAIDVNEDGTFDLTSLPEGFDASKTTNWKGGTRDENTLNVNSHEVRYEYNTGSSYYKQDTMRVILKVNGHKYRWQHDDTKHWRTCELEGCSGLTGAQEAKAPHVYDNAKDNDCNTCGYVRPMYTVTAVNATAKLESEAEELNAPVAAGTEVTLTAGNAPEGKTFAGWKLYKDDTESEITDETELAKLLKNGTDTTATLTMPAYNVKAEPYYSDIPYNIKAENCTVDKTGVAMGDTVTATRREPEANEHFTGWTVKVDGIEQDPDTFLKPDADDPAKVSFVMPAKNVEIKANFETDPIPEPDPVGPSDTGNIQGAISAVVIGAAAGAIIYEAGTGIYRVINMPGIPMPSNRIELAELLWEHAGKPEPVSTALYSDIEQGDTDAQKAAHWAVEQDLMKDDADNNKFNPYFPVSKLRTCLTWNAAKEKGLFAKTEE